MLRQVIRSIGQTIRQKKIKMTEAISSILSADGDIKADLPTSLEKKAPETIVEESGKRQHEEGNDGVIKKFKSEENAAKPDEQRKVFRRKKMIIFLVYSGKGYLGMQRNPGARTIESDLMEALLKAGLVNEEQAANPTKNYFQRAARTDKGVSAAGQLCSSMLCIDVENPVEKVNQHLVPQIRVIGIQKVTKRFDSKNAANARTYMYLMPTFAFAPLEKLVQESYRITDDILEKVNETLKMFKGTRNFHNFTSGKKSEDPSAKRYIMEFQIGRPFMRKELEFAVITVKGQSFMLHQIRKMIGLTIAVVRGMTNAEAIDRAFGSAGKCDVPKAPGLGLMLDRVHYDFYNKRYGSDGLHEPILWEKYTTEIEKFKEEHIYPTIIDTEINEKSLMNWMSTLHMHNFEVVKDPTIEATSTTGVGIAYKNLKNFQKQQNTNTLDTANKTTDRTESTTGHDQPNGTGSANLDKGVGSGVEDNNTITDSPVTVSVITADKSPTTDLSVDNHCPATSTECASDSLEQDLNKDLQPKTDSVSQQVKSPP